MYICCPNSVHLKICQRKGSTITLSQSSQTQRLGLTWTVASLCTATYPCVVQNIHIVQILFQPMCLSSELSWAFTLGDPTVVSNQRPLVHLCQHLNERPNCCKTILGVSNQHALRFEVPAKSLLYYQSLSSWLGNWWFGHIDPQPIHILRLYNRSDSFLLTTHTPWPVGQLGNWAGLISILGQSILLPLQPPNFLPHSRLRRQD